MRHHAACAHLARLAHADDIAAHGTRIAVAFLGGGTDVADAYLGQAGHIFMLGRAAHGVAVAVAHAVTFVHEIQMRVDLKDVYVALIVKGADAGDIYGMIAANDDGQGSGLQCCAHACLNIGVARFGVGVDDISVAHIDDIYVTGQIGCVILVIIGACMTKAEQGRGLAHTAGPKPRAAAKLRARIKGRTQNRHIGVQLAPIPLIGALAEG